MSDKEIAKKILSIYGNFELSEVEQLNELETLYKNQEQEIKRLKERIEDLNIINEEHRILNGKLRVENNRVNNIINEIFTKALDTSITSIDLRDYIISNLGSGKE